MSSLTIRNLLNHELPLAIEWAAKISAFLKCWITQPNRYALGYVEQQKLLGYGVICACYEGYKIGPLFAKSFDVARELFLALCSKVKKGPIFLDVPTPNENGLKLLKENNMEPVFEVMRMYRNGMPKINLAPEGSQFFVKHPLPEY